MMKNDVKFGYFIAIDEECQNKVIKFFRVNGYHLKAAYKFLYPA